MGLILHLQPKTYVAAVGNIWAVVKVAYYVCTYRTCCYLNRILRPLAYLAGMAQKIEYILGSLLETVGRGSTGIYDFSRQLTKSMIILCVVSVRVFSVLL